MVTDPSAMVARRPRLRPGSVAPTSRAYWFDGTVRASNRVERCRSAKCSWVLGERLVALFPPRDCEVDEFGNQVLIQDA